jgi:hypothetical protein
MGRWFARRLQGFTGDCLGATQQVGEIGFYLGAALALDATRSTPGRCNWRIAHPAGASR